MAWTVEYVPERELVLLVVTSEILDEDGKAQVAETIRLLNEHQSTLVLLDCSDAVTKATLPSLYRLPDYATELGAPWNVRVAVVISQTRFRIETFHFFELVFRNAGYDTRLFDDRERAEGWLRRSHPLRTGALHLAAT
ncbi:MAG: hypothetical protein NT167_18215 [Verrucomicrobia bacterium]|jgi:hypothetical protein|nr:hypothetical protein [Verrucomicrobiota bacterium]